MIYFRLGFKNVFRQRLRTLLALAGIALSVALVMIGTTFMAGVESLVFKEALADSGEIVVARRDYFERFRFNPLKYRLRDSAELRRRLLAVPGAEAAIERIDFGFLAEHDERSLALPCRGLGVGQDDGVSKLRERLVAGRPLAPGGQEILLGLGAADELGVGVGDRVTAIGRTVHDSFTADDFEVVGVFDLGNKIANRGAVMPLAAAQELLEMPGTVSKILVTTGDYRRVDEVAARMRELVPELGSGDEIAVRPWTEDPFFAGVHGVISSVGWIVSVIICFVAGLGILNMMMVTVLERRKEMGALMALGMSRLGVMASFLWESVAYGLAGGLLGLVLGIPAALYLDRVGLEFRADEIQGIPFPISSTIHGDFGPRTLVLGLAIGVVLSILGTLGPVLKTFSMGPKDAMTR